MYSDCYGFYKLDDGRVWSIEEARYISAMPDGASWRRPVGEDGKTADESGLRFCLRFFGWPLGELKTEIEYATEVRAERDKLIAATDYLAMPDYPLTEEQRVAVLNYRQALRDVPEQSGFPRQINWPEKNF